MAVKLVSCGYVMRTNQEVQSAIISAGYTIVDFLMSVATIVMGFVGSIVGAIFGGVLSSGNREGLVAAPLNLLSRPVPCPKCGVTGKWEDI